MKKNKLKHNHVATKKVGSIDPNHTYGVFREKTTDTSNFVYKFSEWNLFRWVEVK